MTFAFIKWKGFGIKPVNINPKSIIIPPDTILVPVFLMLRNEPRLLANAPRSVNIIENPIIKESTFIIRLFVDGFSLGSVPPEK